MTFGHGEAGRLGHGSDQSESLPRVVQSLVVANVFVTGVSCGREHTMALGKCLFVSVVGCACMCARVCVCVGGICVFMY